MQFDDRAWGRQATIDLRDPLAESQFDAILREAGTRMGGGRRNDPRWMDRVDRFMDLMERAASDPYAEIALKETMTTSDFPLLFGDVLNRELLGQYRAWPKKWPLYARKGTPVRDFRDQRRIGLDGLTERWGPEYLNPEMTAVREGSLTERGYIFRVNVYQKAFSWNWRALVNDDLGAFANPGERLTIGATRTEDFFATTLYVDANGPHASVFTTGNGNLLNTTVYPQAVDDNPPLDLVSFNDALTVLAMQTDPVTGEPILVGDRVVLVVPPALQTIAYTIADPTGILRLGGFGGAGGMGGTTDIGLDVRNRLGANTTVVVNPYIPQVASSANGNTSWFVFPEPAMSPIEIAFLREFEDPKLFQKAPDTMVLGGGMAPTMGDFETGEIRMKGMLVFGGNIDSTMRGVVASNGSGT